MAACAELLERALKRLASEHAALALVEHAKAGIDARGEGMRLQETVTEAVDGGNPGAVELASEIESPALSEPAADASPELAGRPLRVRDDEDRVDAEPALAHRSDEPLDDDPRLPRAGAGGDEDDAGGFDRRFLLRVRGADRHARSTRHMGASSHHEWQPPPPRGSWRTSPALMRATKPRASSCARSTCPQ